MGVPMLPCVDTDKAVAWKILAYSVLLLPLAMLPWVMGFAHVSVAILGGILGVWFVAGAMGFLLCAYRQENVKKSAKHLFRVSIVYLFTLFLAFLVGGLLGL